MIFETKVVDQCFGAVVLPHHDQQASSDRSQTEHVRMLSSNMLLLNLILLINVTFSTPTNVFTNHAYSTSTRKGKTSSRTDPWGVY
jgi:hypothetical protein